MATPLRVPGQYEGGFAKIRDLSDESVQELLAALWKIPSTISFDSLSSAVAAMVDTVAVSDVEDIVPAALYLHQLKEFFEVPPSDIAERVTLGMEEVASERLRLLPEHHDVFKARLLELLSIEPLSVTAKAGSLSVETDHSLRETRILTDIRPIFERGDTHAPPTGAMILHTLKISYRADNQSKDFFVTLTANDVRELLEQLERANAKAESLKAVIKTSQVPYIDTE